jgi:hypothetical protein
VVLSKLADLEALLAMLRALQDQGLRNCVAQAVLDLHEPITPRERLLLADTFWELPGEGDRLFGIGGVIERINQVVVPPADDGEESDEYPPWSSPSFVDDWIADLTYSLGSYEQARLFVQTQSLQTAVHVLRRLKDLNKGPEQRQKEGLKRWYFKDFLKDFDDDLF